MPATTAMRTNINTVLTNGPNAATLALASAAAGPIMDYIGNTQLVKLRVDEISITATPLKTDTDAGDTANLAFLNGILDTIRGAGSPTGTMIADAKSIITNG